MMQVIFFKKIPILPEVAWVTKFLSPSGALVVAQQKYASGPFISEHKREIGGSEGHTPFSASNYPSAKWIY